jgi:cholesterol transport system auxiliary component
MSALLRVLAGVSFVATAGCTGGFHSSARPEQVYFLRADTTAPPADSAHPAVTLRVARVVAGPGLETSHIVLLESDRRMSYYMASRWAAPLPEVVEELAVESLRSSGAWQAVQSSESGFPSDYLLQIRIRAFESDYTASAAPDVQVAFDCTLGRRSGREIVSTFAAVGSAKTAANKLADVVAAFEQATNAALASMTKQASEAVRRDVQKVDSPVPSINR